MELGTIARSSLGGTGVLKCSASRWGGSFAVYGRGDNMVSQRQEFEAVLYSGGEGDSWTMIDVPFDLRNAYGSKGRVPVKVTVNGYEYRTSIFPMGKGAHVMMVNKEMLAGGKTAPGQKARITMEKDDAPRPIVVPNDLQAALDANPKAKVAFDKLPPSHRREYIGYVDEAKKPETRAKRVNKTVEMLEQGAKK